MDEHGYAVSIVMGNKQLCDILADPAVTDRNSISKVSDKLYDIFGTKRDKAHKNLKDCTNKYGAESNFVLHKDFVSRLGRSLDDAMAKRRVTQVRMAESGGRPAHPNGTTNLGYLMDHVDAIKAPQYSSADQW